MKVIKFTVLAVIAAVFSGCTSTQISRSSPIDVLAPVLGLGGAAAGLYATKGSDVGTQLAATAAGAVGAYLVGEFVSGGVDEELVKEFAAGYNLGRSNSAKELYWSYQKLHNKQADDNQIKYRIYDLPAPFQNDGIKRVASTISIPIAVQ